MVKQATNSFCRLSLSRPFVREPWSLRSYGGSIICYPTLEIFRRSSLVGGPAIGLYCKAKYKGKTKKETGLFKERKLSIVALICSSSRTRCVTVIDRIFVAQPSSGPGQDFEERCNTQLLGVQASVDSESLGRVQSWTHSQSVTRSPVTANLTLSTSTSLV